MNAERGSILNRRRFLQATRLAGGVGIVLGVWLAGATQGATAAEGGWIDLFDGRSLTGWRAAENPGSFQVVEGAIACNGPRAHLFYEGRDGGPATFRNFELSVDVRARKGANSGVFFHTRFQDRDWPAQGFEVQVNNSQARHGNYLELKKTGSLYGVRNVHRALAADDTWFTLRIEVRAPRVRIWVGDQWVVDYREPDGEVATSEGPLTRLGRGTFALQCHDPESHVFYRNLRVRPLPDDVPADAGPAPVVDPVYLQILELGAKNFPVIDLHGHLKGGLTLDELLTAARRTGINYGVAVNCGLGFPVTNDAGALAFLREVQGRPVFSALQGEGREWPTLVSREVRRQFDYVFTDAMTFKDARGRRTRLWMPNEVEVVDPQAFVDYYVDRIVEVLGREPIDIYVNPTFLPEVLAGQYDALWTEARMRRVIDAAKRADVAIEINARYRIPNARFLRLAKAAGVKFSFGTNNGDRDLGRLEYCLEMQRAVGLTWEDMFVPGVGPRRADRE